MAAQAESDQMTLGSGSGQGYEYRIDPPGKILKAYYADRSRVSFIMGPLGSAKTITTCLKILTLMAEQEPNYDGLRPSRWVAVRNTYIDLMGTTVKDWLAVTGDLGVYKEGGKHPPTHRIDFILDDDNTRVSSEMIFLALDRDEHVKKLRGMQCTGFWLNETKELGKAIVDMADLRHGRMPSMVDGGVMCSWHGMVGDTNPPDDDHWYYRLAERTRPKDWKFFRQPGGVMRKTLSDESQIWIPNPEAENLPNLLDGIGYYVRGMEGKSDDWISVNLAGEYGSHFDGKPVYTQFNERLHVGDVQPIAELPLLFFWDFGLTPACLIGQMTDNGQLRILCEFWSERAGIKQFGIEVIRPYLALRFAGYRIGLSVGDPAGKQGVQTDENTCLKTLSEPFNPLNPELGGVGIKTLPASTNGLEARTQAVKGFLNQLIDGKPAILIDRRCDLLIKGFKGGYHFKRVQVAGREAIYKDEPDKNKFSHVHDGLQYGCLMVRQGLAKPSGNLPRVLSGYASHKGRQGQAGVVHNKIIQTAERQNLPGVVRGRENSNKL